MDETSLSGLDNFYLQIEQARQLQTLASVWVFDDRLDSELVHQTLDWLCDTYPRYASVPSHGSMLHPASWTRPIGWQPKMNVERHQLKTPTREALEDYISDKIARPFIYSKPLWELHAISGLEDDRVAFLWKAHRCLGDAQHVLDQLLQNNRSGQQQQHHRTNANADELPIPDPIWVLFPLWMQGLTMHTWHALSWLWRAWITVLHDVWIALYCLLLHSSRRDLNYKGQQMARKQVSWSNGIRSRDIMTVSRFLSGGGDDEDMMDILVLVIARCIKSYLDDMNLRHDDSLRLFVPIHHGVTSGTWGWFSVKDKLSTHQQLRQIRSEMQALRSSRLSFQRTVAHLLKHLPPVCLTLLGPLRKRVSDIPHGIIVDYIDTNADTKGRSTSQPELGGKSISQVQMIPPQLGKGSLAIGLVRFAGRVSISVLADHHARYPRLSRSICDRFPFEFQQLMREVSMTASRPAPVLGS